MAYYWVVFSRMIDARISGEMKRTDPRVFARPFELRRGQALSPAAARRSAERSRLRAPAALRAARRIHDRPGRPRRHPARRQPQGRAAPLVFGGRAPKSGPSRHRIDAHRDRSRPRSAVDRVTLDAPLITALVTDGREKRRDVPLQVIPEADGPGGARDRGPALLRSSAASTRSARRRRLPQRLRRQDLSRRRQHPHPAAREEHVPDPGEDPAAGR